MRVEKGPKDERKSKIEKKKMGTQKPKKLKTTKNKRKQGEKKEK